jgi:hypothetical protein
MRIRIRVISVLLFLSIAVVAGAQSIWPGGRGPVIGVDLLVGTPSAVKDVFQTVFPGASLRFIASPTIEFSLDYAFMDIGYYYPESGNGPWRGPIRWSSMPERFDGSPVNWIFFHTSHFIAPQVWYLASLEQYGAPLAIRVGAGPAISFVIPNEAARFYPGLSDAFEEFKSGFKTYLGFSFRVGIEYRQWKFGRFGMEYLFVIDSLTDLAGNIGSYGMDYINRAGNLVVFTGIRL